jgi:hypothetical protein
MTSQRQTTLFEDVQFDADKLANEYGDSCQWLVALSDWQITVIMSLLRYAEWSNRWTLGGHSWDEIEAKISELEYCLMAGCNVEDLIKTQRLLIAAITGTSVDLESELPTGTVDYAGPGLASALRYDDKNIAQIVSEMGEGGNSFTLQEFIDNFDPEELTNPVYAGVYALLNLMKDLLPDHLVQEYKFIDPPGFIFNLLNSLGDKIIAILQTGISAIEAGADTGAAAADVAGAAVTSLDTIFQGVTAGALSLQAIIDLIGLFGSGQTPDADTNPDLRSLTRVYNDVFVEGDAINVSCAPDVTVNCGGGGGQGGLGTPGDGGLGGTWQPPSVDPETEFEVDQDKCDRVTYLANEYITRTINTGTIAGMTDISFAVGMVFYMNAGGFVVLALAAPGVAFILGAVVIGAIIGGLIGTGEFANWAIDLEETKEDFICAAHNAKTQPEVRQAIRDWIEATIPALWTAWTDKHVDLWGSDGVCAWILTGEGFTPPDSLPTGDCSTCGEPVLQFWVNCGIVAGTWISGPVVNGLFPLPLVCQSVTIGWSCNPSSPYEEVILQRIGNGTVTVSMAVSHNVTHHQIGATLYEGNPPAQIELVEGSYLGIYCNHQVDATPFTVTLTKV